ncbi:hypothetical protein CONPUDRAFT_79185 [Coniophora puteana RWD-64-598 SS2]|uniref:Copper homeostasis protein cutC homolog n=1 Tax=Coniophora puteana (strain RWD-64-598) TaxID=741705 RepID=A0A5M3N6D4_CONPW|nr:uncharacterized protein CONPUDRAFT_79185 [Coniophora puteana RWD-64-598 SS2]EIW86999.1 hypothetical protein CONPUDRAFT_79185 [Coniophora puteana RWD-64-598 SS2]
MAMIRPRIGDFLYSPTELEVMMEDIRNFKANDAQGVVFGVLTADGNVDVDRTRALVEEASPLQVCFHRAIDMVSKDSSAWQDVFSIPGITRVLTSGMAPKVTESLEFLKDILQKSRRCAEESNTLAKVILPGSGINAFSVPALIETLLPHGLGEIHLSGGQWIDSKVTYRPVGMGMGGVVEWGVWITDEAAVRSVREIADKLTEAQVD